MVESNSESPPQTKFPAHAFSSTPPVSCFSFHSRYNNKHPSSLFLYCLQAHINITVPTDTTSIITTLRTMASIMAAATASSSTSLRATPFLGQSRTSANALKDVVPMGNAKYTMVISW